MTFTLIEPELGRISGGLRYNAELAAASAGRLTRLRVPGTWSAPTQEEADRLSEVVAGCRNDRPDRPVLLDGLLAACLRPSALGDARGRSPKIARGIPIAALRASPSPSV